MTTPQLTDCQKESIASSFEAMGFTVRRTGDSLGLGGDIYAIEGDVGLFALLAQPAAAPPAPGGDVLTALPPLTCPNSLRSNCALYDPQAARERVSKKIAADLDWLAAEDAAGGVLAAGALAALQSTQAPPATQGQDAARAEKAQDLPSDQIIELAGALEVRRILEAIKDVARLRPPPAGDTPSPFDAAWQACCEEIFYRATGEQWHMDEDAERFNRAALAAKGQA